MIINPAFTLLLSVFAPCGIPYDLEASKKVVSQALLYQDNWEYVVADHRGKEKFTSKADLIKNYNLVSIPVLALNPDSIKTTTSVCSTAKAFSGLYISLLLRKNQIVTVLRTSTLIEREPSDYRLIITSIDINQALKTQLKNNINEVFYDALNNNFCIIKGNALLSWDEGEQRFTKNK